MADNNLCSSCNSETKIVALKEALCTQQQLLQKLYIELEEEREASATAASEALSMILRLQGEKAAEKMEAIHYRRMAEEKIQHAEESLMIFRELMYEKEMEIASLEYQVRAYSCKLLGIGSDPVIAEMRLPHNPSIIANEVQLGELAVQGIIRRSSSSLVAQIDGLYSNVILEKEEQGMAELYLNKSDELPDREFDVPNADMQSFFDKFAVGDLYSYREQIKQLDEQLKEFSHCCSTNQVIESRKSATSKNSSHEPIRRRLAGSNFDGEAESSSSSNAEGCMNLSEIDEINIPHIKANASENSNTASSLCDIFEVPNDRENRLKKPESIPCEPSDCCSNDESELVKKTLQHVHQDNKISGLGDKVTNGGRKALADTKVGSAASQAEVQKLDKRLEKLECERRVLKQETSDRRDEELMLLREIKKKLDMVQSEIRSSKVKNHELEEYSLVSVMEDNYMTWAYSVTGNAILFTLAQLSIWCHSGQHPPQTLCNIGFRNVSQVACSVLSKAVKDLGF